MVQAQQAYIKANRRGIFEIRWSEPQPDGGFRSKRLSTRTSDIREAQVVLEGWRAEARRLTAAAPAAQEITVKDVLAEYLDSQINKHGSLGAVPPNTRRYVELLGRELGHLPAVNGVTAYELKAFRDRRDRSAGTIRRELVVLVAAFNVAAKRKMIARADIPDIPLPPAPEGRKRFLTESQERGFHAAAMAVSGAGALQSISLFVALGLNTGARKSAILGLTWDRVHLDDGAGFVEYGGGGVVTNKRRANVPINGRLRGVLERARDEVLAAGRTPDASEKVVKGCILRQWRKLVLSEGLEWVTPHVMRHTFATLSLQAGVSIWAVAGCLGDTTKTVEKHYGHHARGHLADEMDKRGL